MGHSLQTIEWIVHAVTCAKPNPKLRAVLEHRGFAVADPPVIGAAYHLIDQRERYLNPILYASRD